MSVIAAVRRVVGASLVATFVACPSSQPLKNAASSCPTLSTCREILRKRSEREAKDLDKSRREEVVERKLAIVGDGIAGTAVALNLKAKPVRVYGGPSFWEGLEALPAIWQTTLDSSFNDAGLVLPRSNPSVRIKREVILHSNLDGLVRADAAYLSTSPVLVTPGPANTWTVVDSRGHSETITDAVVVATGLLRPLRITDRLNGADSVRRLLAQSGKVVTGDDFLSDLTPVNGKVVGIAGTGGNAADCLVSALARGATEVVVWGKYNQILDSLLHTQAGSDVLKDHGNKICRVDEYVTKADLINSQIIINSGSPPLCANTSAIKPQGSSIDLLVESLGRYTGDAPPVVVSAADGRSITYEPVLDDTTNALIAVRVWFGDRAAESQQPAMYLVGAAASWIPPSVTISAADRTRYDDGLKKTLQLVNPPPKNPGMFGRENGPASFAVAAFMGSHLARRLSR